jgi:hypothetical protein
MPQGKLKTKTNQKPPPKKSRPEITKRAKGITKKGKYNFAPKQGAQLQVHKFKKAIQKDINSRIESDIKALAIKQGEGKALKLLTSGTTKGSLVPKNQK